MAARFAAGDGAVRARADLGRVLRPGAARGDERPVHARDDDPAPERGPADAADLAAARAAAADRARAAVGGRTPMPRPASARAWTDRREARPDDRAPSRNRCRRINNLPPEDPPCAASNFPG